ncbi:MAG: TrmH family RNA methyltransferase [Bacilli bacterium]
MIYTSIENKKIKDIKNLNRKKFRDQTNQFIVEGEHLVLEAYKAKYLTELILEKNEIFNLDIKTSYVTKEILNYISELENPPKIMGICNKIKNKELLGNKILILDNIQDPGNLGTIIRSAVAFNIDTIVLGEGSVDLYNSKVIRAAQGMIYNINIININLIDLIPKLKLENYKIFGTKVTNGKSLKKLEKYDKFAIIMGNEGNGMSDAVTNLCDDHIYIEMSPVCESLNVGIAASIILYELNK